MIGIRARRERRNVADERAVLAAIRTGVAYGYDIHRLTGLRAGRTYMALRRLEAAGLIFGEFQDSGRRGYRVTDGAR